MREVRDQFSDPSERSSSTRSTARILVKGSEFETALVVYCLVNGMDRSCEATIYPVLDKPHTTGAFQDRRKIEALLRPA